MFPQTLNLEIFSLRNSVAVMIMLPLIGLSGCAPVPPSSAVTTPTAEPVQQTAPAGPEFVEGKGYRFTWVNGNSGVVTAPADIKKKALDACLENGFLAAYMSSIAFTEGAAEGYFNCRGTGGN